MENPYAAPRQHDHRPGCVKWPQFFCAAAVAFISSGALALVLHLLFRAGLYFVILAPATAALVLGVILWFSTQFAKCRSRALAALLSLAAANIMYWGQYYFDMVDHGGRAAAYRLDLLPSYIVWRKNQEIHKGGNPVRFRARKAPQPAPELNWFTGALEFGTVLLFTVAGATASAGRPYCPHCQQWMRRDAVLLPAGAWQPLLEVLATDSLDDLLDLPEISAFTDRRFTAVTVAWCPPRLGREARCPAYLSIKDVRYGGGLGQVNQIDLSFGRIRLKMHPLSERQIASLRLRFPEMAKAAVGSNNLPLMSEDWNRSLRAARN